MPDAETPQVAAADEGDPRPVAPLTVTPAADLVERARAFRDRGAQPVPAKPSATVVLLRDGEHGLEVFMLRRLVAMSFAGGMHVFPGGVVDPADSIGRSAEEAIAIAAIRETFEESGLLLASGALPDPGELEEDRFALVQHRVTFDAVLAKHGLVPEPRSLRAWSHWITPDFEPRRYDTHFFVAVAPENQDARDMGGESDDAAWVTPAAALAAAGRGDWLLMPPTQTTLRELAPYHRAADAFDAAAARDVRPLRAAIDLDADPPRFVFRTP